MEIADFTNKSIWAIQPEHLSGMLANLPPDGHRAVELSNNLVPSKNASANHLKMGIKIEVIPIVGPLSKQNTFLTMLFGGSSTVEIGRLVSKAVANPEVDAIVLDIDSPGGTVAGADELANTIYSARNHKPVIAFSDGSLCSAAYWIGSAAHAVLVNKAACVGSIGIVMVHSDYSGHDAESGIRRTVISSGKLKAVGNSFMPLSDDDRAIIQGQLDQVHGVFVAAVAKNLGVPEDVVWSKMADGGVSIGEQAVQIGLAKQCGNFTDALGLAASMVETQNDTAAASGTVNTLEQASAGVFDNVTSEGMATIIELQYGGEARQRFEDFSALGGKPEVFLSLMSSKPWGNKNKIDGMDTILADLRRDSTDSTDPNRFNTLVHDYQKAHGCGKIEAMQAVIKNHPKEHKAYIEYVNGK